MLPMLPMLPMLLLMLVELCAGGTSSACCSVPRGRSAWRDLDPPRPARQMIRAMPTPVKYTRAAIVAVAGAVGYGIAKVRGAGG